MGEVLGMGVVGAGAIGLRCAFNHLTQEDVQDRVRITAVCDPVPGRAEAAAKKFGVPRWYLSLEGLLADKDVDAVTLGSPIGLHYQQGLAAVAAGKHVHFNKTMATAVAECDELIARAAQKNLRLVASPGMMLHPFNQRIKAKIKEGAIGQVVWAATGVGVGDYHLTEDFRTGNDVLTDVDPTWYFRRPGGGPLYDVTVYCLHNLTGLLGPAKRVTAFSGMCLPKREYRGRTIQCDMDDSTFISIDFGHSVYALAFGTVAGSVTRGFNPSIFGTAGSVVGTKVNDQEMRQEGDHQPHVVGVHAKLPESHVYEDIMQLVDWVQKRTASIASAEHARHVIDIIESGYRAAETGKTQTLQTTF